MYQWINAVLVSLFIVVPSLEAKVKISFNNGVVNLKAEDETYGNIFGILAKYTGLGYQIPNDVQSVRIPIIEIENMDLTTALSTIMEGSQFDFFVVGRPEVRNLVFKLIVPGKAKYNDSGATNSVQSSRGSLDPFSAGSQDQHSEFIKQGQTNRETIRYGRKRLPDRKTDRTTPQKKIKLLVNQPYGQLSGTFPKKNNLLPSRATIKSSLDHTNASDRPVREFPNSDPY